MSKTRKLVDELLQDIEAMHDLREGKISLRIHTMDNLPPLEIDAGLIRRPANKKAFENGGIVK